VQRPSTHGVVASVACLDDRCQLVQMRVTRQGTDPAQGGPRGGAATPLRLRDQGDGQLIEARFAPT